MLDVIAKVRSFEEKFWWLRGAIGALSTAELATKFFDLDKVTWLTGVHLIVIAWSNVCGAIGILIGEIPFLPEIPSNIINTAFFALAILLPAVSGIAYQLLIRTPYRPIRIVTEKKPWHAWANFGTSLSVALSIPAAMVWVSITGYYRFLTLPEPEIFKYGLRETVHKLSDGREVTMLHWEHLGPVGPKPIDHWFLLASLVFMLSLSLYYFKSMRRGYVYVIGFFVACEILLMLQTADIAEWICEIARDALTTDALPGRCATAG